MKVFFTKVQKIMAKSVFDSRPEGDFVWLIMIKVCMLYKTLMQPDIQAEKAAKTSITGLILHYNKISQFYLLGRSKKIVYNIGSGTRDVLKCTHEKCRNCEIGLGVAIFTGGTKTHFLEPGVLDKGYFTTDLRKF